MCRHSIAHGKMLLLMLIKVSKDELINNDKETESLPHLFQVIEFRCEFDLTPVGCKDKDRQPGDLRLIKNELKLLF